MKKRTLLYAELSCRDLFLSLSTSFRVGSSLLLLFLQKRVSDVMIISLWTERLMVCRPGRLTMDHILSISAAECDCERNEYFPGFSWRQAGSYKTDITANLLSVGSGLLKTLRK